MKDILFGVNKYLFSLTTKILPTYKVLYLKLFENRNKNQMIITENMLST